MILRVICRWAILILALLSLTVQSLERPNILFVAIDDLRPALGCYGDPVAHTPNIDKLAKSGVLFENAYCQEALCSPSRWSVMTGMRPDTIQVWDLSTHPRKHRPDLTTLPEFFRLNGYTTGSIGKILHGSGAPSKDPESWSVPPVYDEVREPELRYALPINLVGQSLKRSAVECAPVQDNYYVDGKVCEAAIKRIDELSRLETPFFLGVGFRKPHLPFCAPERYWDLYEAHAIPSIEFGERPKRAPEMAYRSWMELEGYWEMPKNGRLTDEQRATLRHGYYACVSYIDALLGKLLLALEERQLRQSTIICLWSDHGFHLGEQGIWAKGNNYELSTQVPLIIADPQSTTRGKRVRGLVELIDLHPTLLELCGYQPDVNLEGRSLAGLIRGEENQGHLESLAAYSQWPRALQKNRHKGKGDVMGYSVRTKGYRMVEWWRHVDNTLIASELYELGEGAIEKDNLIHVPELSPVRQRLGSLIANYRGTAGVRNGARLSSDQESAH